MVLDEPKLWNSIPAALQPRVECAAKAMCRSVDMGDEGDDDHPDRACLNCDTPAGGTCIAFGLYGHMALEVVKSLEVLDA